MPSRSGRILSGLLSLSVLTGSVLPPAYCHSHPGGDAPHAHRRDVHREETHGHAHHDSGHGHRHPHTHHRHRAEQAAESPDEARTRVESSIPHWHVTLLWFEFTLPGLPHSGGGSESDGNQNRPVEFGRVVDFSRALPADSDFHRQLVVHRQERHSLDDIDNVVESSRLSPHPPVARLLLCDTARRERSGVLLT